MSDDDIPVEDDDEAVLADDEEIPVEDLDLDADIDDDAVALVDDDDLVEDDLVEDDLVADVVETDEVEAPIEELTPRITDDEEDEEVDLEDEAHPDDVEEALDVVLRERTKQATLVEDEEDDDDDEEAPARRSAIKGETFVCSSCYFVKPIHQLVDPDNKICIDCA